MIGGASAFILTSDSDDNNDSESGTETTYYTIQASATAGGNISPSGQIEVAEGESKTFTFTPDTDYELSHIMVDGKRKEVSGSSYTFSNVSKNHTISAVFEKVYKPVNPSQPVIQPTKYVVGMDVEGTPGTQHLFNPFNAGDMTVTLKYSDGTQKVTTDYDVSPADFNKEIGTLDVLTISYMGFEKLFEDVKVEIGSETPISTFDELQYFAQLVNTEYQFSGKTVYLTSDIDMSSVNKWTPIGTEADPFRGTFDGNGHTLFNLNVSNTDSPAGLFGSMDGIVKNLTIDGANIIGGTSVGTVAGEIPSKGAINDVVVINADIKGNKNVGGIVGYAYGSITGCTVKGKITITVIPDGNDNSGYDNGGDVGGIVGYLGEGRYTVTGNKVLGTEGTPIQIKAYRDIGGIIGTAQTVNTGSDSGNNNLVSDNSVEYVTITVDQFTDNYGMKDSNVGKIIGRNMYDGSSDANSEANNIICQVVGINALQSVVDDTEANSDFKEFVLAGDITGDLIVTQKLNVQITINGNDQTFAGSIIVNGKSARYEGAGLTIINVNFQAASLSTDAYVNLGKSGDNNTRYTNNVTIQNCTFSGEGGSLVAVKSYTGGDYNLKLIGCTVNEGMHSALQVANIEKGLEVIGCHIYSKNGINLNNTPSLYMKGCVIETEGYAVRVGVGGATYNNEVSFTMENCTLTSANDGGDTTIMIRGKYNNATLTINNTDLETTEISPSDSGMKILLDGKEYVSSTAGISSAINSGNTDMVLTAGSYDLPSVSDKDVTFSGTKDVIITVNKPAYHGSDVTFNGVTVKGSGTFTGVQHVETVTYNDVKIVGEMCLYGKKVVFNNCTFELNGQYIWTYGAKEVEFNNCIFNTTGKAILIYNEGAGASTVTVKGCTFNATAGAKAGAIANQNCAAIEIDNFQDGGKPGVGHKLITAGNTYDSNFSGEWRIKNYQNGTPVTVNDVEYIQIAVDGKLMTKDSSNNVTVL